VRLDFGDCTLDLDTRELFRGGKALPVEPKAFGLLETLITARPRALSKSELQDELWPKTFVSERSLARLVVELRKLIGDRATSPRFIRTVHGFGYAFHGEVAVARTSGSSPSIGGVHCRLVWGDREIALVEGPNILGRDPDASVWIDMNSVSRRHARITLSDGVATLEDLRSKNGTYLAGRRIDSPVRLKNGDRIKIGAASLVFKSFRKAGTTESQVGD
jgi:DNA-binding winged helix-turn-helix (wHTH) protein